MKMKKTKLVATVLIANFNNANYIDECIKSIIKQTFKKIEIIFIDDGSKDSSLKVIKKYSKKIKIIKKKNKTGIGSFDQMATYYQGFKESKGDVIFLLDSDDYFKKDKVSIFMDTFLNNKKINILYDLPIKKYKNKNVNVFKSIKYSNNYWPYFTPTSCIAIRTKYFKIIYKLIGLKLFSDIWFDFRIGIVSKHLFYQYNFIEKNLTYYRQTQTNISSKFKHLSLPWWTRRMQAHDFVKYFFIKNKITYVKNLDYYLTSVINFFIK